jgi:hypothetical protein
MTMIWKIVVSCVLYLSATAELYAAPGTFAQAPSALPQDARSLSALESTHVAIVRRASRMCAVDARYGGAIFKACTISLTDSAVATSENDMLMAYHQALPIVPRYDENRASNIWRAWLVRSE